ncbi:Chromatin accessibility complex protein 1 [Echinococcus granulosus]|uniref:Chromatin accessibility complex protein n=1 Tax=Echinococcus granulosus TaxID=6210 RepID=W6U9P3_ECHGR|nr:Chromatin accessibility complex protein [Echinococcus granulosus]EUB58093.1 Chromatin accessibility complex protein [Echinococcus granulosus]KAH9287329.1 Chromatin accessibility complex protein 1 [Echinococcus granulosus]
MQDTEYRDEMSELPLCISPSRMRTMMKSSPDVECVSTESVISMIKATELFIKELVTLSNPRDRNEIGYHQLSELQTRFDRYSFLSDILPQKITAREWSEKYKHLFLSTQ